MLNRELREGVKEAGEEVLEDETVEASNRQAEI